MSNKIIYLLILLTDVNMGVIINTMNKNIVILFLLTFKARKTTMKNLRKFRYLSKKRQNLIPFRVLQ